MTQLLQAVVLGIVQGLTEFIPVSSSGHLVLVPRLFGWGDPGLAFDVALHVGTLLAVLVYFRAEWVEVIKGFFTSFSARPSRLGCRPEAGVVPDTGYDPCGRGRGPALQCRRGAASRRRAGRGVPAGWSGGHDAGRGFEEGHQGVRPGEEHRTPARWACSRLRRSPPGCRARG